MCKSMKTSQVQRWFAWGHVNMMIVPMKSTCCSKFKLHCRNMKEGEHGNCLTSFLTHWTKKTAAKKFDKVSKRAAFGNSSLHAASSLSEQWAKCLWWHISMHNLHSATQKFIKLCTWLKFSICCFNCSQSKLRDLSQDETCLIVIKIKQSRIGTLNLEE